MAKRTQPLAVSQPQSPATAPETALARHSRKCAICNHPERATIEEEFVRWAEPAGIVEEYELPARSSLYLHAHATGLLARRNQNLRGVAERIMEYVDSAEVKGNTVLRAMRIYASITEDGRWREPARHSVVTHIHRFESAKGEAVPASPNDPQITLKPFETKSLPDSAAPSAKEILIATPNTSRGDSSD